MHCGCSQDPKEGRVPLWSWLAWWPYVRGWRTQRHSSALLVPAHHMHASHHAHGIAMRASASASTGLHLHLRHALMDVLAAQTNGSPCPSTIVAHARCMPSLCHMQHMGLRVKLWVARSVLLSEPLYNRVRHGVRNADTFVIRRLRRCCIPRL